MTAGMLLPFKLPMRLRLARFTTTPTDKKIPIPPPISQVAAAEREIRHSRRNSGIRRGCRQGRREETKQRIRAYLGIKYLKNSLQYLSLPIDENVQS